MNALTWLVCWTALSVLTTSSAIADAKGAADAGPSSQPIVYVPPGEDLAGELESGYRGQISLTIKGFRNSNGRALVTLFRSEAGFPGQPPKHASVMVVPISAGMVQVRFDRVAPGPFAVSVLHDEDGDGTLRQNVLGVPKEGLGYSRDPHAHFGPPDFDDCVVQLGRGKHQVMTITMDYY